MVLIFVVIEKNGRRHDPEASLASQHVPRRLRVSQGSKLSRLCANGREADLCSLQLVERNIIYCFMHRSPYHASINYNVLCILCLLMLVDLFDPKICALRIVHGQVGAQKR